MTTHYLNTTKSLREEWNGSNHLSIFYSYATPVAFRHYGSLTVSENVWSRTTGKHLTQIDGGAKKERVPHEEFEKLLNNAKELSDNV
jgi:hypothetical protein|tara:strand:+ start:730 stop:990 length:261 start_codon:yes stop_codon:yes gene_type:complete